MAKVEIYKIKKIAPSGVRDYSVFDYMRNGVNPNPLHYVREWAGEMHGTLPLTIPGRLMLEPPKDYHGGDIKNGDIAVVNGTPYFMDKLSGSKFVEIDFDTTAVKDAINVKYGWFVDVKSAEAISDVLSYVCDGIGIPVGYLGEQSTGGVYNDRRPFLPGSSVGDYLRFLHPEFMKGVEAQTFISLLSELTESERWTEIFDYLREHYPANQQDLESACELFAPELLFPAELRPLSKVIPVDADKAEVDYLIAKINNMDDEQRNVFYAAIEGGLYVSDKGIAEFINIAENLDCFNLKLIYDASHYGMLRLEGDYDVCAEAIARLEKSSEPDERFLAKYITLLNRCADDETYGYHAAKEEGGVFTKYGLIMQDRLIEDKYRNVQDIPAEYNKPLIIESNPVTETIKPLVMLQNVDLAALLLEMHAVGGEYMRDAKYNLKILADSGKDFFIIATDNALTVTSADFAYRRDMSEFDSWMLMDNKPAGRGKGRRCSPCVPDVRTFFLSVTGREDGRIVGNLYETNILDIQDDIRVNSFFFTHLDAEMKDGTERRFTLDEWDAMEFIDRDKLKSWVKTYDPADEARLADHLIDLRNKCGENCQPLIVGEFLSIINAQYMEQAKNPQTNMLRVTLEAAKEILAQNAANVFRLTQNGMERLFPVNAAKANLWYSVDREFAIPLSDWAGIDKWAQRNAGDMLRQMERSDNKKSHNTEL